MEFSPVENSTDGVPNVIPVRLRAGALWNVSFHHNGVYCLGW